MCSACRLYERGNIAPDIRRAGKIAKELQNRNKAGMDFSKWLNNCFIPENPDHRRIKEVSSKSVKKSIMNAESVFKRFSGIRAVFRSTGKKEKGYLPINKTIKSGAVSCRAGRYYVSVLIEETETAALPVLSDFGLGIDLGLKKFAVTGNGTVMKNINKTARIRKLEKQLKREQRCLSRKYEDLKKRDGKKGEATRQNIRKQQASVQRYVRLARSEFTTVECRRTCEQQMEFPLQQHTR